MAWIWSGDAILFDMDGTLVDSTRLVERFWTEWGIQHGIPPQQILAVSHGRRTIETVREFLPNASESQVQEETYRLEHLEEVTRDGVVALPGAWAALQALPVDRWAVVTSAPRLLAERRLAWAGLPLPRLLVPADEVAEGKPHPEGYLRAARQLGFSPDRCLVVEDAPAGVLAGERAGMTVLGLATTFPAGALPVPYSAATLEAVTISFDGQVHVQENE